MSKTYKRLNIHTVMELLENSQAAAGEEQVMTFERPANKLKDTVKVIFLEDKDEFYLECWKFSGNFANKGAVWRFLK